MTTLFSVDFENGLLFDPVNGFDLITVSGGKLEVLATAKHDGVYGLSASPVNGYISGGARMVHNPATGKFRQAFWMSPGSIVIPSGSFLCIARNFHYDLSQQMYGVFLGWNGTSFTLGAGLAGNTLAVTSFSADYVITIAWHLVEIYWQKGTPGSLEFYIDGVLKETLSTNNDLCWITTPGIGGNLRAGAFAISGSVLFDRWRANNDGGLIGP